MKISIIMGIYNCEKYLSESIESILNQTFKDWQLIMCDDGSTDDTYCIAKSYKDKYPEKILLIQNEKNMGLNYTLNKCLRLAEGQYIARQDGDDVSLINRFEKEVQFLDDNKEFALVSSNMIYFDENGEWGKSRKKKVPQNIDFVFGSPFCHAPCMIRREVMEEVEGYTVDDKLLRVEDYHLWFKIYKKGYKGYNINEIFYMMRDNREAFKRRNFKNRINETRLKLIGFKMLRIPLRYYIYAIRPLAVGMLPEGVYKKLHRLKLKRIKYSKGE